MTTRGEVRANTMEQVNQLVAYVRSFCEPRAARYVRVSGGEDGEEARTAELDFDCCRGMSNSQVFELMESHVEQVRMCDIDDDDDDDDNDEKSSCTRRIGNVAGMHKQALIHGLNYIGSSAALEGCINDADNMQRYLTQHCGYGSFLKMTDRTHIRPTRANMLRSYDFMLGRLERTGGTLFYHYSGHGSQVYDYSGDERTGDSGTTRDGKDETLCPLDYRSGMITDDTLFTKFVKRMAAMTNRNVRMIGVTDACHSGSMYDLRFSYSTNTRTNKVTQSENRDHGENANVVMISGCRDEQTSADARPEPGVAYGALSNALLKVLRRSRGLITWRNLIVQVNIELRNYTQVAQLSSEQELNLDEMINWSL